MDESHLISAVCSVSLNPVRARLVVRAEDWPWSSVRAHVNGADDGLVTVLAVLDRIPHFADLLATTQDQDFEDLRRAEGSGRRLGRQSLSPVLNDCLADLLHAALQDANPRPASPAYS
jgi:putative transposase